MRNNAIIAEAAASKVAYCEISGRRWMALGNFLIGCLWCVTVVGIPFGKQFFKIAKLALSPFGASVR